MLPSSRSRLCLTLALCASTAAWARAGELPASITIDRSSHGFSAVDGRIVGAGPDYRVEIDEDGFSFTAAFGAGAPRTWPLDLSLESIGRAEGRKIAIAPAQPVAAESALVTWDFGTVDARLESSAAGVEQSFVFEFRPEGAGDLVVRQRIATDLARSLATTKALRFDATGFGSITVGAVTGIDANGARVDGELRVEGDVLEYRLPAAFVDSATYPLILDPTFGVHVVVANDFDEHSPDVAFDETLSRYLVVWSRQFSTGDYDLRGQILDSTGAFVGGLLSIDTNANVNAVTPRIGNMNNSSRGLVTWVESTGFLNGSVKCRAVSFATGSMSSKLDVSPPGGLHTNPDVGGESQEAFDRAIITWQSYSTQTNQSQIMAANVIVPISGNPTVLPAQVITSGFDDTEPAISSHDLLGFHMIVWRRSFSTVDSEIRGVVVDKYLTVSSNLVSVTNNPGNDYHPAVDGDGYNFLVAYETDGVVSGDHDVLAIRVRATAQGTWEPASPPFAIFASSTQNSGEPDVHWFYSSTIVTWKQEMSDGTYRAFVGSFDPHKGGYCESNTIILFGTMTNASTVHIGGAHGDNAMIVRSIPNSSLPNSAQIVAQSLAAIDGGLKYLSGPCGAMAYANCARVGNSAFAIRVTSAPAFAPSYLIVGSSVTNVPCGPCALVVNPTGGLFLPTGTTDANGENSLVTGIPNTPSLAGLKFLSQWLIVKPGATSACTPLNTSLSSGMEITLQ